MVRKKSKKKSLLATVISLLAVIIGVFSYYNGTLDNVVDTVDNKSGAFSVHFIDVGQGNSTLVQSGANGILIDAGESEYGEKVCNYIESCGVKTLSAVILTHQHSDHMGGMSAVLEAYKVGKFFMPELLEETVPTSRSYERLLDLISEKSIDAQYAQPGDKFDFGSASFTFIGPEKMIDDLNNMSLVMRIAYGKTSFLICGDAEKAEMKTLVNTPYTLKSDIYLMSHHASSTGIYNEFLNKISPSVAIISCGAGNSYGHPHKEALNYIKKNSIESYRTDTQGSIVFNCTASGYTIKTEK